MGMGSEWWRRLLGGVLTAAGVLAIAGMPAAQGPPQGPPPQGAAAQGRGRGAPPSGGMLGGAGPADKPPVDPAAATRGGVIFKTACAACHGEDARGTAKGANLVRSLVVLEDRYGSTVGPFLEKGHPTGAPVPAPADAQLVDLANFLRQRVNDALRGSPLFQPGDVLVGNAQAGAAFFNGPGECATCHSATGDLAGIGGRYRPIDLQQRMMFPRSGRGRGAAAERAAVLVTVTPQGAPAVNGTLVQLDDFTVILREPSGAVRSFQRSPSLQVVKHDPLAPHIALLDTITDTQMHDLVAYLETLK